MGNALIESYDYVVERLRAITQEWPDLKEAAQVYETILPILRDADLHMEPVSFTPDQVRAKIDKGLPLLYGLDLDLDREAAHGLALCLIQSLEAMENEKRQRTVRLSDTVVSDERYGRARRIRIALEEEALDIGILLGLVMSGDRDRFDAAAETLQLDPGLLWTVLQNVIKPALNACRLKLEPLVGKGQWGEGICYVCGYRATLGELQGNGQTKHLRCGQCGADWEFQRLKCGYCRNEDHRTLNYLYAEGWSREIRVEVCEKCKGYLKVIAAFTPTPPELIAVEDFATLHMDYIAESRGHRRNPNL